MKAHVITMLSLLPLAASAVAGGVSTRMAVQGNPRQEYFLIDHSGGREPAGGHGLLLVLPGGEGSADFNPFVTSIGERAAGPDYLVAQLIAVKWTPDQQIVWPTGADDLKGAKFTTEEFVGAVIADVRRSRKVNPEHVYTLSWSSGGPAAYAASLEVDGIRGSFVAMSVFRPDRLPRLSRAKGHRYYIFHSPGDTVCPIRMAEDAKEQLSKRGARVELATYEGGHGWHGDIFGSLKAGFAWLEAP